MWHRGTQRLSAKRSAVKPQYWISKPNSFASIVDVETFERAQAMLPRLADSRWSDEEIIRKLRRLLTRKGYLSESLILKTRGMPAASTLHHHFGTYRQLYKAVGYKIPDLDLYRGKRAEPAMRVRRELVKKLSQMFPEQMRITRLPHSDRSIVDLNDGFLVAVLVCVSYQRGETKRYWTVVPTRAERDHMTLLCKLNAERNRIVSYHLLPRIDIPGPTHSLYDHDPLLKSAVKLRNLSAFYAAVQALRRKQEAGSLSLSQAHDSSS